MVQSIPYDPSMVLGSIVHKSEIDVLLEISSVLGEIEAKQRRLNNVIMLRRKLKVIGRKCGCRTCMHARRCGTVCCAEGKRGRDPGLAPRVQNNPSGSPKARLQSKLTKLN